MRSRSRPSLYKKAEQLASRQNSTPIELAEALWHAEQREPGSVAEIVRGTDLGRRKAFYLLKVWERFAEQDISKEDLVKAGWTKLAVIAKHPDEGLDKKWVDLAPEVTVIELEAAIVQKRHREKPKPSSILLRLSPAQYKVFSAVLTKFGAKPPKRGKGLTLKEQALTRALRELL